MKNVLKKVSAIAMALTLLGSGTAIATKIDPKSTNTITASAACQYHGKSYYYGSQRYTYSWRGHQYYKLAKYCSCCGGFLGYTDGIYIYGT